MTPDAETLKSVFATNRNFAGWATIAVFVGLLGDIAVIFLFRTDKSRSETWLAFICTLIIAVGVYGEYNFGSKAAQAADQLQQLFERDIAFAKRDAAEAQLELAKFKAPREISLDQRKRIVSRCKGFPKTPFILLVDPSPEAVSFLAVIEDILVSSCGWSPHSDNVFGFAVTSPKGYQARILWGVSGVVLLSSPDRASDFGPPAKAVADALTAEGVKARAETNNTAGKKNLYVIVGQKPN
jgi:hypothetical protein